jgi:hypothetical protein
VTASLPPTLTAAREDYAIALIFYQHRILKAEDGNPRLLWEIHLCKARPSLGDPSLVEYQLRKVHNTHQYMELGRFEFSLGRLDKLALCEKFAGCFARFILNPQNVLNAGVADFLCDLMRGKDPCLFDPETWLSAGHADSFEKLCESLSRSPTPTCCLVSQHLDSQLAGLRQVRIFSPLEREPLLTASTSWSGSKKWRIGR